MPFRIFRRRGLIIPFLAMAVRAIPFRAIPFLAMAVRAMALLAVALPAQVSPAFANGGAATGFADSRRLDEHYAKHGAEFGAISKQDYLRQAQALRDAPVGGPILETVRADGVHTRFDRRTGAFLAFNANGVIRTYFRPNDGERYFRRQQDRDR